MSGVIQNIELNSVSRDIRKDAGIGHLHASLFTRYLVPVFILFLPISDFKYFSGILPGSVPASGLVAVVLVIALILEWLLKLELSFSRGFLPIIQFMLVYTVLSAFTLVMLIGNGDLQFGGLQLLIRLVSFLIAFCYLLVGYSVIFSAPRNQYRSWFGILIGGYVAMATLQALGIFVPALGEFLFEVRGYILRVNMGTPDRVLLLAAEPSFVVYQMVLVLFIARYLYTKRTYILLFGFAIVVILLSRSLTGLLVLLSLAAAEGLISLHGRVGQTAKILRLISLLAVLGIVVSFAQFATSRIASIGGDLSALVRFNYNYAGVLGFLENPVTGLGIGQYSTNWIRIFHEYGVPIAWTEVADNIESNNMFLTPWSVTIGVLSEGGAIGIISFGYLLLAMLIKDESGFGKAFFLTVFISLLNAYSPAQPYIWLVLSGVIAINARHRVQSHANPN